MALSLDVLYRDTDDLDETEPNGHKPPNSASKGAPLPSPMEGR